MANTVQIILDVDDKGSVKIRQFSSTLTDQVKQSAGAVGQVEKSVERLIARMISLTTVIAGVSVAMRAALKYLGEIETAGLGISAAFMTGGQYIDATSGKALTAQAALRAAQNDSRKIIQELQYANLQTIATLDQLIIAYQQTLPVAMAKGFDKNMVKEFTVAIVQAAGAIGLPMDQLAEETRSLLTGAINPRNSRIATVLGLRNEDIAAYEGNASQLFEFLMNKLAAYRVAGIEAQNTWAGLWSNVKDMALQFLGQGVEPLFEAIKSELQEIISTMATLDEKTKTIKWNPQFLNGVQSLRDGLESMIAEFYRLGMLADKVGGSLTRFTFGATFGAIMPWGEALYQRNQEWLKRYDESSKALQNMAMRSAGWKPMTPEMDRQIREAVLHGKKIADQTWVNIGGDGDGTNQLLRYYRLNEQKTSEYKQSPYEQSPMEADLKLREDYLKKWETIKDSIELQGYEKEMALLSRDYELYRRFVEDKAAVDRWYSIERANLISGAAIKAAEEDKKSLESRLSDTQEFYQSVQQMIQKNIEDQKKGVAELNALYKQMADVQKSGEAIIRGFQERGMTPEQKYQSQKTTLYDQYMAAMRESGQEQVKSLEEFKQAAASFVQTWNVGQDEMASVSTDVERATNIQKRALASLAEERQKQMSADQAWGAQLVQTAQDWAAEINKLKGVIGELEAQIAAMQKTITISGDDRVSYVVDNIARALATLHDKTVEITTIYRSVYGSESGGSGSESNLPGLDLDAPPSPTPYALGTGYVPKTGMYLLHRGEAVTPPAPAARQSSMRIGDINIIIPESAAPQRLEDWRYITREYIVPELEKIGHA